MTSSATARARARRQMHASGEIEAPQIQRRASRVAPEVQATGSHLRLVPTETRRRSAVSKMTFVVIFLAICAVVVIIFQATIAEQQLRLDALTNDLRMAEVHHNNLRQERAELLSPSRLREEAVMMGMYQGMSTTFTEIPADVVAEVMASTAKMNPLFRDPLPAVTSAGALAALQPIEVDAP
ncbi:MAG: hypothetical protein RLZZ518_736 [Actinomycetota bacterium]